MDILQRRKQLETRVKLNHEHLLTVMATQRERVEKAFDEVKLAMLEQDLAVGSHSQELTRAVEDLAQLAQEHEERLRNLEDKPPAA